jgi:hypothetical protein
MAKAGRIQTSFWEMEPLISSEGIMLSLCVATEAAVCTATTAANSTKPDMGTQGFNIRAMGIIRGVSFIRTRDCDDRIQ